MKLTTHFHLMPKLGTRGVIPPPQYVFMVWCFIKQEITSSWHDA